MPDALNALSDLGIQIPAGIGIPFRGIRFVGENTSVEAEFPAGYGLALRRPILHQILMDAAEKEGVDLLWGTSGG